MTNFQFAQSFLGMFDFLLVPGMLLVVYFALKNMIGEIYDAGRKSAKGKNVHRRNGNARIQRTKRA